MKIKALLFSTFSLFVAHSSMAQFRVELAGTPHPYLCGKVNPGTSIGIEIVAISELCLARLSGPGQKLGLTAKINDGETKVYEIVSQIPEGTDVNRREDAIRLGLKLVGIERGDLFEPTHSIELGTGAMIKSYMTNEVKSLSVKLRGNLSATVTKLESVAELQ